MSTWLAHKRRAWGTVRNPPRRTKVINQLNKIAQLTGEWPPAETDYPPSRRHLSPSETDFQYSNAPELPSKRLPLTTVHYWWNKPSPQNSFPPVCLDVPLRQSFVNLSISAGDLPMLHIPSLFCLLVCRGYYLELWFLSKLALTTLFFLWPCIGSADFLWPPSGNRDWLPWWRLLSPFDCVEHLLWNTGVLVTPLMPLSVLIHLCGTTRYITVLCHNSITIFDNGKGRIRQSFEHNPQSTIKVTI